MKGLKTFRCRLKRAEKCLALDCLAPSPEAAAFAAARSLAGLDSWIQVEVREWIPLLREHLAGTVVTIDPVLPAPPDAALAVLVGAVETEPPAPARR